MGDRHSTFVVLALLGLALSMAACGTAEPSPSRASAARATLDAPDGGFPNVDAGAAATGDTFDGPGGSCKLTHHYGSPECASCMSDQCCAPIAACEADAVCNPLHACITDCLSTPDIHACYLACLAAHPGVKKLWAPVEDCWFYNPCGDRCSLPSL